MLFSYLSRVFHFYPWVCFSKLMEETTTRKNSPPALFSDIEPCLFPYWHLIHPEVILIKLPFSLLL